ncbi:hypothetical protein [Sinorhizobium meliloti]|uniref:hypothetical protein n=1 Tax=Rhizobium meliloti TaxID=382 RepID=UPI00299E4A94|nr:hypothetical protein [Sinorhizobium meliloti]
MRANSVVILRIVTTAICTALPSIIANTGYAQESVSIDRMYSEKYAEQLKALEESQKDEGDCLLEASFDAEWGLTKVAFDVPEVTFKMQEIKFHFITTSFNMQTIAFDIPEFEWGTTSIGSVKLDLPQVYSKRVEIKTKIPEFKWEMTTIKTKIPEFKNKRVEWKFHILKIGKLREASIPCKKKAEDTQIAGKEIEALSSEYAKEATTEVLTEAATAANELASSISLSDHSFEGALRDLDSVIGTIVASGGDPKKVNSELDGKPMPLTELRSSIQARRQETLNTLTNEHDKLLNEINAFYQKN